MIVELMETYDCVPEIDCPIQNVMGVIYKFDVSNLLNNVYYNLGKEAVVSW